MDTAHNINQNLACPNPDKPELTNESGFFQPGTLNPQPRLAYGNIVLKKSARTDPTTKPLKNPV
jgi:hypothetical protein